MRLKFKPINLGAGRPIAFISNEFAEKLNIAEGGRVEVIRNGKKLTLAVNVAGRFLKENEISFSDEAVAYLKIRKGHEVEVSSALRPKSTRFILKKINNKELTKKEIYSIIKDIVDNTLDEAEIAYFVSGVYHSGMTFKETLYLTEAMAKTGKILKWRKKKIADKHSIGGIAGNRTTPIVVSICAAAGVIIPKTSSRAITSAGGTADVMEVVTNVNITCEKLKRVVQKTNACLAWGGSLGFAPADDKLIKVEKLLKLDPKSQIIASIIAKKLAAGSKYVLIDIPYGEGAKVSFFEAKKLKKKFLKVGKHFKLKLDIVLTKGEQPIGNGIGPVLEIKDVLRVLKREKPPRDLEDKSVFLAGEILEIMGKAKKGQGKKLACRILDSCRALKKFEEIVSAQGKKKTKLTEGKFKRDVIARGNGKIKRIDNKLINTVARALGCPADKAAGIYLYKHVGDKVKKGEKILTLYSESKKKLNEGVRVYGKVRVVEF